MKEVTKRRTSVSSSKISAILNKNRFRDVVEQWLLDTKQKEATFTATALQKMEMGTQLEPVIKNAVEKHFDIELTVDKNRYHHDEKDYFTIEFDALDYANKVVYEFKNTEMDEAHILEQYYAQVQFAMYIIGWDTARICYLRNGWDLGFVEIKRDENFIEHMVITCDYYWHCLESHIEPDIETVNNLASNIEFYKNLHKHEGVDVEAELEDEDVALMHEWGRLKRRINELEIEEARIKGHFAEKWGKYKDEYINYSNAEYEREGGYDIRAIIKDHPEIDFKVYKKPNSKYKRQILKYKAKMLNNTPKVSEDLV
jgi:predicted phage-related endonuclease